MTEVTDAMVEAALDVMRGQDGGLQFMGGVDRVDRAIMHAALEAALSVERDKTEAIRRAQAWITDERHAGRCVIQFTDKWVGSLLAAAEGAMVETASKEKVDG